MSSCVYLQMYICVYNNSTETHIEEDGNVRLEYIRITCVTCVCVVVELSNAVGLASAHGDDVDDATSFA